MGKTKVVVEKTKVIVGLGSCGLAAGAGKVYDAIKKIKEEKGLDFELKKTSCIGMCFREPLVEVIDGTGSYIYGEIDIAKASEILEKHIQNADPIKDYVVQTKLFDTKDKNFFEGQVKIALRNCGYIDPESVEEYEAREGYDAIKKIAAKKIGRAHV